MLTKLTAVGLIAVAIALWTQWLSGDPAFGKFPAGPVIFIAIAGIIILAGRWWWAPLLATPIALLVTLGWFARLHAETLRLTHPGTVGKFAAGMWLGVALQIVALLVTDVASLAATVQNFRRRGSQLA